MWGENGIRFLQAGTEFTPDPWAAVYWEQRTTHIPLLAWREGPPPSSLALSSWWFWRKDGLWYSQWPQVVLLDPFQRAAREDTQKSIRAAPKVQGSGRITGMVLNQLRVLTANRALGIDLTWISLWKSNLPINSSFIRFVSPWTGTVAGPQADHQSYLF